LISIRRLMSLTNPRDELNGLGGGYQYINKNRPFNPQD